MRLCSTSRSSKLRRGWVATLEQALPHARYRAIALYDARGEVLHCTSTDFGIEFRQALNDALDAFVLGAARESRFLRGEGTRTAVMLALRDLHSALQGVCLLVVEDSPLEDEDPAARFLTPAVTTILADIASEVAQTLHAMPRAKPPKPKPPVPLPLEAVYAQIRNQEVVLRVQQLVRLRKAEGMRRFEVLLRHMVDGEETVARARDADRRESRSRVDDRSPRDRRTHRLAAPESRRVWKKDPPAFSVNLSDAAVIEPHFISFVESCLQKSGFAAGPHRRGILRARLPHESGPGHAGARCVRRASACRWPSTISTSSARACPSSITRPCAC